jgi:hypothetical protein
MPTAPPFLLPPSLNIPLQTSTSPNAREGMIPVLAEDLKTWRGSYDNALKPYGKNHDFKCFCTIDATAINGQQATIAFIESHQFNPKTF